MLKCEDVDLYDLMKKVTQIIHIKGCEGCETLYNILNLHVRFFRQISANISKVSKVFCSV